ncbi:MAG: hypothetical protein QXU54_02445 [Candidatus Micrarchaeia archaeon]
MQKIMLVILAVAILGGVVSAGCALDAYKKACASCPFDANGRIDQSCSSGYRASGVACVSTSYPIMSTKYSAGECPAVDACAAELTSCVAQYSTGNDRADCQAGDVAVCYAASDKCVERAAIKCGEIEKECPGSSGLILFALALGLFVRTSHRVG